MSAIDDKTLKLEISSNKTSLILFVKEELLTLLNLVESAEKEGVYETYQARQDDAASFWKDTEEIYVKPILDKLDPELRAAVMAATHSSEEESDLEKKQARSSSQTKTSVESSTSNTGSKKRSREDNTEVGDEPPAKKTKKISEDVDSQDHCVIQDSVDTVKEDGKASQSTIKSPIATEPSLVEDTKSVAASENLINPKSVLSPLEAAVKEVKAAYIAAKKAYRISDKRRARVQEALNAYLGTRNFHNYTIQKGFKDPSAKRVIRSFEVGKDPVIINDTEWLSLKVHGQSFMMHQIRKMVAMVALVVRCGSPITIISESYGPVTISIPKAPGLGLLLERPVFETYNERAAKEFSREKIDFNKFQKEMDEFKQREIYDRIFREEEKDHQ